MIDLGRRSGHAAFWAASGASYKVGVRLRSSARVRAAHLAVYEDIYCRTSEKFRELFRAIAQDRESVREVASEKHAGRPG